MKALTGGDKSQWQWAMMILQPDFVSPDTVHRALFL
jgi:hypothetical protein